MRLSLIILNLFVSMIICSNAFAERVVLTDPNADGRITAKEYAQTDPRLSQKVTYEAKLTPVKQIISDLRDMTGVSLMAGKNESDWPVRSRKMNIFIKDVPLYELMDSIARVMKFSWSLSDDDKMIYRLKVNKRAAAEADAMMKRAEQTKEQIWQKRRQEWVDAIEKYGDKPISELDALRDSSPQIYEQAMQGSLKAIHVLFEEVPETKDRYLVGRNFRVSSSVLLPETKRLLYDAGNELWKHLQRIGYVGGKKTQDPPGYGPRAIQEDTNFDVAYKRTDRGLINSSLNSTGFWSLHRNLISRDINDFELTGFNYMGSPWSRQAAIDNIRINGGEDVDEVRKSALEDVNASYSSWKVTLEKLEETLYPSEPLTEHTPSDQLQQKIKIDWEALKPDPNFNRILRLAESVANLQKGIFEASGIGVVSDSWTIIPLRNYRDLQPINESTIDELLTEFCNSLNHNWDKPGPIIEFRNRKWAKMRLNQIPDEWVAIWSKNTESTGFLSLDDYASISNLTEDQVDECLLQDAVIGVTGVFQKMTQRLDDNLDWLRLYSRLTQQQRRIVLEGERGLFGQMLTSEQWKLAQTLFDRIGITRGEALMQADLQIGDDPQYTYWFKLIDTDTGEVDRLFKLILPRYNPPKATTDK